METPKYITLEVSKLENIIINSINKVYGSYIGYITKNLKEALIENDCTDYSEVEAFLDWQKKVRQQFSILDLCPPITEKLEQMKIQPHFPQIIMTKEEMEKSGYKIFSKNIIGIDVMKNEYQNIPIKSDNNDTK